MLTLTSVDLGRAIDCYTSLTNATRTGAQFGASHGHTDYSYSEWEERVIEASAADLEGAIGVNTADVAFHVSTDGASAGDAVSVETEYSFETLVAWPGLPSSFPIRTSCTFRRFR